MTARTRQPGQPWQMPKEERPDYDDDPIGGDDEQPRKPLSYNEDFELPPVHNRQPTVPPVGVYIVQVDNIYMEEENRYNPDMARLRFEWRVLKIIDSVDRAKADGFLNQIVHSWCNMTMGPNSTLRGWSETLLGRVLEDEEKPDKRELIGAMGRASYVEYTKANKEKGVKLGNLSAYKRPEQPARPASAQEMSGRPQPSAVRTAPSRQPAPAPRPAPQPAPEPAAADDYDEGDPWSGDET
jgi:hypothetical protein